MKIWIDGQCFQTPSRRRGIGRYVIELLKGMRKVEPELDLLVSFNGAMPQEALYGKRLLNGIVRDNQIYVWHGATLTGEAVSGDTLSRRLSEAALRLHVQKLAPDIALSASPFEGMTDSAVPLLPKAADCVRSFAIFYDAIPLRMPETYLPTAAIRQVYMRRLNAHRHFDGLLAISDYATREAGELVPGVPAHNIMAAVHSDFLNLANNSRTMVEFDGLDPKRPTLLYVGGADPRKNLKGLVQGVGQLDAAERGRVQLIVVGDIDPVNRGMLATEWSNAGLEEANLLLVGFVSDTELVSYYNSVDLVVQPSMLEGFGLTVLEAMTCGTPVIAANAGALPEVVYDPALLFNPHDPRDIARAIGNALHCDAGKAARLVEKAKGHAQKFSWDNSAKTALDFFRTTLGRPLRKTISARSTEARIYADARASGLPLGCVTNVLAASMPSAKTLRPRVFIDITATALADHKTGIQRVVKNISLHLQAKGESTHGRDIAFIYWGGADGFRLVMPDQAFSDAPLEFVEEQTVRFCRDDIVLMLDSTWEAHADIFGCLQAARLRGAKVVSILYDLVPVKHGCFCDAGMPPVFSAWLRHALQYSDGVACISEAVAIELNAMLRAADYPLPVDIGFWPLGADFSMSAGITAIQAKTRKERSLATFLTVGTMEPRKGHAVIVSAFNLLWARGSNAELIIVGKPGWGSEDFQRRIRIHPEYGKRLIWHEGASDAQLSELYQSCDALIAASFAEGFGLPIVEAAHFGKPIIASDIPVFREVSTLSDHADFFEVGDAEDLADTIDLFLRTPYRLTCTSAKPSWPSWKASALALLDLVEEGSWQHRHVPRVYEPIANDEEIWAMKAAVPPPTSEALAISLIDGPTKRAGSYEISVRVDNRSSRFWSSTGNLAGYYGVRVWCRPLGADGCVLIEEFPRVRFPLIVWPGDSCGLKLIIPPEWFDLGMQQVEVGLVQEGISYWEPTLKVTLNTYERVAEYARLALAD